MNEMNAILSYKWNIMDEYTHTNFTDQPTLIHAMLQYQSRRSYHR